MLKLGVNFYNQTLLWSHFLINNSGWTTTDTPDQSCHIYASSNMIFQDLLKVNNFVLHSLPKEEKQISFKYDGC